MIKRQQVQTVALCSVVFFIQPFTRAELRLHNKDLRHAFTTRARECEIDNELVAVWTGHSLGNITSRVYTHFSMEFQKEQAVKLKYII